MFLIKPTLNTLTEISLVRLHHFTNRDVITLLILSLIFKMKKLTPYLILVVLLFQACVKQQEVSVIYEASQAVSAFSVSYQNEYGLLVDTIINPQSNQDIWRYKMFLSKGDIVYLSGKYDDINSGLKLSIIIDGKVFKEQYSLGDTVNYLIVSGTIPY